VPETIRQVVFEALDGVSVFRDNQWRQADFQAASKRGVSIDPFSEIGESSRIEGTRDNQREVGRLGRRKRRLGADRY
jgi:hypothetical protein